MRQHISDVAFILLAASLADALINGTEPMPIPGWMLLACAAIAFIAKAVQLLATWQLRRLERYSND